jgi:hypothetical protein
MGFFARFLVLSACVVFPSPKDFFESLATFAILAESLTNRDEP